MAEETSDTDIQFLTLVFSLSASAWAALGKVPHPVTGKMERDLPQAKASIDLLMMLRDKTQGNLTAKEEKMLADSLADLELNYADEVAKGDATKKGPDIIIPGGPKDPGIVKP